MAAGTTLRIPLPKKIHLAKSIEVESQSGFRHSGAPTKMRALVRPTILRKVGCTKTGVQSCGKIEIREAATKKKVDMRRSNRWTMAHLLMRTFGELENGESYLRTVAFPGKTHICFHPPRAPPSYPDFVSIVHG